MAEHCCPGQDLRYWTADDIFEEPCAHCGEAIEFFKDDAIRCCPSCGRYTLNPKQDLSCGEWCHAAKKCLAISEAVQPDHPQTEK
jgi:rRNA maturation protein Nop10